jgi:3-hydroxybutyrate dehydrogenase
MAKSSQPRDEVIGDFLKAKQPSRRFVLPEQIADLIVFLCSEAASEMTGTPISMDGGWMATS